MAIDDLSDNEPTPVTIRVTREDGYDQVVDRQVVFLVRSGTKVTALSPLARTSGAGSAGTPDDQELKCPCHGGVFDRTGAVKSGPAAGAPREDRDPHRG